MVTRFTVLWVIGLLTLVPYWVYFLLYEATRDQYALYLVLHNAARFGGGQTVDVTVSGNGGRATITVRDRGRGFGEEAFRRAFDPFYSTSDDGLGLGLPHARKVVEGMGGRIELRNVPDGGAEVELSFPA